MLADWRYFALASAGFAALTAIFGRIGVSNLNSDFATLVRTFVILIFASAIVLFRREWQPLASVDSRSLQLGPASKVAPLDKMSVALTILLAYFILGESISLKTALGGSLILLGSLVLFL